MTKDKNGITVTEIIIVGVIIATITGIALPAILKMKPRFALAGATRQVHSDLMLARSEAVSQNNDFKVDFDNDIAFNDLDIDYKYEIIDDDNNNGTYDPPSELRSKKDISEQYKNISIWSTVDPSFDSRGIASGSTIITLELRNSEDVVIARKFVRISSVGKINIYESGSGNGNSGNGNIGNGNSGNGNTIAGNGNSGNGNSGNGNSGNGNIGNGNSGNGNN